MLFYFKINYWNWFWTKLLDFPPNLTANIIIFVAVHRSPCVPFIAQGFSNCHISALVSANASYQLDQASEDRWTGRSVSVEGNIDVDRVGHAGDDWFIAQYFEVYRHNVLMLIIILSFTSRSFDTLSQCGRSASCIRFHVTFSLYMYVYIFFFYTYIFTNRKRSDEGAPRSRGPRTPSIYLHKVARTIGQSCFFAFYRTIKCLFRAFTAFFFVTLEN